MSPMGREAFLNGAVVGAAVGVAESTTGLETLLQLHVENAAPTKVESY